LTKFACGTKVGGAAQDSQASIKRPLGSLRAAKAGAPTLGLQVEPLYASTDREIDAAFANVLPGPRGALLVSPDAFFFDRRVQLVTLAARQALLTIYSAREFVDVGGLLSYGTDIVNAFQEAGTYTGRILKGEKPADIPVEQPTKFELVINLKTAKALGLTIPPTFIAAPTR